MSKLFSQRSEKIIARIRTGGRPQSNMGIIILLYIVILFMPAGKLYISSRARRPQKRKRLTKLRRKTKVSRSLVLHHSFPECMTVKFECAQNVGLGTVGAALALPVYINFAANSLIANGANVNSGGTTNIVPAGLIYLLGSPSIGGNSFANSAPYSQYRIKSCTMKSQFLVTPNVNFVMPNMVCASLPETSAIVANATLTNINEQPGVKWRLVNQNKTSSLSINHRQRTSTIYALKGEIHQPEYAGAISGGTITAPANLWYHNYLILNASTSASATFYGNITFVMQYEVEFFNRNQMSSATPT